MERGVDEEERDSVDEEEEVVVMEELSIESAAKIYLREADHSLKTRRQGFESSMMSSSRVSPLLPNHRRLLLLLLVLAARGVSAAQDIFFPFGASEGDTFLAANDDGSTPELPISVVFPFFDHDHDSLFVNNNGVLSFLITVGQYTPDPFPLDDGRRLITPFWGDVDTNEGGWLSFREVLRLGQNEAMFEEADSIIRSAFIDMRQFTSSWLYIATWDRVAFYGTSNPSITNTFQAVLVTDGRYSFAIFNYDDINWTTGTASGGNSDTGLGGTPAQVGFNAGDGIKYYSVPGSRTNDIVDVEEASNVGVTGRYVFRTDSSEISGIGCTPSGDISLFPLIGTMLGGTQVLISGPCFNDSSEIVCKFDGALVNGVMHSNTTALCVSPTFFKTGHAPLDVSVDGGASYRFHGTFSIVNIEDVPTDVTSNVIGSSSSETTMTVSWNTDSLIDVSSVDVVIYGYNEVGGDIEFEPIFYLARGVQYESGTVTGTIPDIAVDFDVGVIAVIDSATTGGSLGAALWSEVHVLQWLRGYNPIDWCLSWPSVVDLPAGDLELDIPCPCTTDQAVFDISRFRPDPSCNIDSTSPENCAYKPDAQHCVRAITPSDDGEGQQCCYDSAGDILNVELSRSGGFSHRYHHDGVSPYEYPGMVPYLSHFLADTLAWTYCCLFSPEEPCILYGLRRPSQVCNDYEVPMPAGGTGDPHFTTFDELSYTFNGYGEFTLLEALQGEFVLQVRTAPFSGTDASVIVAIAARYGDGDVIHVQTNERRVMDAYIKPRGESSFSRLDFDVSTRWTFTDVSVTGEDISSQGILVAFIDRGVGIELWATEGAMSILLSVPETFKGNTKGLMGTWNNRTSDDFVTPSGRVLPTNLTTEEIHYDFGLEWEISWTESLFFYDVGADHESHTDRSFLPAFEIVVNPTVNQSRVDEVCGYNGFCYFDYHTTGSEEIARATAAAIDQLRAIRQDYHYVTCPTLDPPENGAVLVSRYSVGGLATFSCDQGYELSHVVILACQADGSWSGGDVPQCIYVPPPPELEIICESTSMTLLMDRTLLDVDDDASDVHFIDEQCVGYDHDSNHVAVSTRYDRCGTRQTQEDDSIVFTNRVTYYKPRARTSGQVITREHILHINVTCRLEREQLLDETFVVETNLVVAEEEGYGEFVISLERYTDSMFHQEADDSELVSLGEPLYFGVNLTTLTDLTVFMESCWATPYPHPSSQPKYFVLDDGCASDSTLQFRNYFGPTFKAFQVDAFTFIGDYDEVYVHCDVLVCDNADLGSRCAQGCVIRSRRDLGPPSGSRSQPHTVTIGPLSAHRHQRSNKNNEVLSPHAMTPAVIGIVGALIAIIVAVTLLLMRVRARPESRGYRPVSHDCDTKE
ncbi:protein mesh-like [Diadema antillarum]|uniref:protein mesh-like n=1 Tax=Diadema antillarum TaxID=105358 RepID=UPI003A8599F9